MPKRKRSARPGRVDQSPASCVTRAATDWNGRGSIESIRPPIDCRTGRSRLVPETLDYCSTFHGARDSFGTARLASTSRPAHLLFHAFNPRACYLRRPPHPTQASMIFHSSTRSFLSRLLNFILSSISLIINPGNIESHFVELQDVP